MLKGKTHNSVNLLQTPNQRWRRAIHDKSRWAWIGSGQWEPRADRGGQHPPVASLTWKSVSGPILCLQFANILVSKFLKSLDILEYIEVS